MASMSRDERAREYAKRLNAARDIQAEAERIKREVDSLVYSSNEQPLPLEEKKAILKRVKEILQHGEKDARGYIIVEASDNSEVLDVIDSIENEIGK